MTALEPLQLEFGYGPARAARMESARAMRRALPASFLLVAGLLASLAVSQRLLPPSVGVVELAAGPDHHMIPPGVLLPEPTRTFQPGPPTANVLRVPLPVPDTSVPAVESVTSPGGEPGVVRDHPGTPGGTETGGALAPDPEPGAFVYTDQVPARVHFVAPVYSDMARDAGVEGTVMLWALVDLDGTVKEVRVLRSVPLLDESASSAVRQWRFTPALASGHPVRVWVAVPVKFTLR